MAAKRSGASFSRTEMLIKPGLQKWYENELYKKHVGATNDGDGGTNNREELRRELEYKAARILQHDVDLYKTYKTFKANRYNFHWLGSVMKNGTLNDKLAAYTVLLQDSAPYNLTSLESILKMVDPKGMRECLLAADALKDVFLSDLLPPNRKLKPFGANPLGALEKISESKKDAADVLLLLWHFEARLKQLYINFVSSLSKMTQDPQMETKEKGIRIIYHLLSNHPEQEQLLLRNMVNKIGDPANKLSANVCHLLLKLVDKHPAMKSVITDEVERLFFRPNISKKSSYYSVCFLNQFILDETCGDLAAKLISMYLALFKASIKKNEEVNSKLMGALLSGVNRAFPFSKGAAAGEIGEQLNALYRAVHESSFNVSVQALTLLFLVLGAEGNYNDRFYCALYGKLFDPSLKKISKPAMFINLLFKTLKSDDMEPRVYAFIKRILQIIPEQNPAVMCGLLFIISESLKNRSKRLLMKKKEVSMDDGEEKYSDVDDTEEKLDGDECDKKKVDKKPKRQTGTVSWVHRSRFGQTIGESIVPITFASSYDPFHRNPLFARAQDASTFELLKLSQHYHPSVALFAKTLLEGKSIVYTGDPLQDFTLINFLNRFVFRNPKKPNADPDKHLSQWAVLGKRKFYVPLGMRSVPVNEGNFVRNIDQVPIDELFFFNYFCVKNKYRKKKVFKKKGKDDDDYDDGMDDDDIMSVGSDDFEAVMDSFEPKSLKEDVDVDFAHDVKSGSLKRAAKKKKKGEVEDSDIDDDDDDLVLDDEYRDSFKEFEKDIAEAKAVDIMDLDDEFADAGGGILGTSVDDDDMFLGPCVDSDGDDNKGSNLQTKLTKMLKNNKRRAKDFFDEDGDDYYFNPKGIQATADFGDMGKYFASADEFASLLEENANSKVDTITSEAFVNTDNSSVRQIRWEQERDRSVREGGRKMKKMKNKKLVNAAKKQGKMNLKKKFKIRKRKK